jgi:Integrase core domain
VRDLVAERVAKSGGRISAKRLLPIAQAAGYEGSARNFRRLVAEQKALWRKDNHRGRRPAVWAAGEYLVIDWAEAAPGLFVFCAVLAFSRWRFVRFAADQKATTTMAMITEALAAIGGVPARVLADRMGCLKAGVVANVLVPTPDYVRFATHYGFRPDWCEAGDPVLAPVLGQDRGHVVRLGRVVLLGQLFNGQWRRRHLQRLGDVPHCVQAQVVHEAGHWSACSRLRCRAATPLSDRSNCLAWRRFSTALARSAALIWWSGSTSFSSRASCAARAGAVRLVRSGVRDQLR